MEINQNNKRKPLSLVDLRQKFGQSPKPLRSPKHKRKKISYEQLRLASLCFPFLIALYFVSPPPLIFRSLRVASINVRGLKDNNKGQALFYKLKSTRYDVIYLQDTRRSRKNHSIRIWNSNFIQRKLQSSCEKRVQGHARSNYHNRHSY